MTKEEYIKEVQKIEAEKRALDEEYRRSMPVQPHQVVVILSSPWDGDFPFWREP